MKKRALCWILLALFLLSACGRGASEQALGPDYRAVANFAGGFVAAGNGGMLSFIGADQQVTPLDSGTDANLLCAISWQDRLLIGGANGTLLELDANLQVTGRRLGTSDIISLAAFQGKLYACTRSGTLYASEDGSDWTGEKTGLKDVAGMAASEYCLLAATADADIFALTERGTALFNYNEKYDGLDTALTVRGVGADPGLVWLLGAYDTGAPAVLHSELGEYWVDRPTVVLDEGRTIMDVDTQPFALVYIDSTDNRMLLCDRGHLLVLTDCQECNQYYESKTDTLTAGDYHDGRLCLVGADEFISIEE